MLLSYVLTVVSLSGVSLRPSCGTAICYNICVDCRQAVPPEQLSLPLAPRPAVWYPILTKRRRVPGAFERLAGRIGKQVQSLYGTAAVRGAAPAKDVTAFLTREGWPGRGVRCLPQPSKSEDLPRRRIWPTGPMRLRFILHAAPKPVGSAGRQDPRRGRTKRRCGKMVRRHTADLVSALFFEGACRPLQMLCPTPFS